MFVPYCTQDVYLGDEPNVSYNVEYVSAQNMHWTLQWVFGDFLNPSNIFITGCYASGTGLPVIYELIDTRYNNAMVAGEKSGAH